MNIKNISKEKQEVIVSLTSDELVLLMNVIYSCEKYNYLIDKKLGSLYCDIVLASSLSRYGNIDLFDFSGMAVVKGEEFEKAFEERKDFAKKRGKINGI